jgi:hypothetical protein
MDPEDPESSSKLSAEIEGLVSRRETRGTPLFARGPRLRRSSMVVISIFCCLIMLLTIVPTASATPPSNPGPPPAGTSPTALDFAYDVSPSLFPAPANLSSANTTNLVKLIPLDLGPVSYGMVNASPNGAGGAIWFESGGYSPSLAAEQVQNPCGNVGCPSNVAIMWNVPIRVANLSARATADGIAAIGSQIVVTASTSSTTQLWNSSNGGESWSAFGVSISGTITSVASNSTLLLLVTESSSGHLASTFTKSGSLIAQKSVSPSGSKSKGILGTSATFVAKGLGDVLAIAMSVSGSNLVQLTTSSNGGVSWSADYTIGNVTVEPGSATLTSVGGTLLSPQGWVDGQIGPVGVGSELVAAFPTLLNGQVILITEASTNYGVGWDGPYRTGPVNGTIHDLSIVGSPAGLVYAGWLNPDANGGAVVEAIFFTLVTYALYFDVKTVASDELGVATACVSALFDVLAAEGSSASGQEEVATATLIAAFTGAAADGVGIDFSGANMAQQLGG